MKERWIDLDGLVNMRDLGGLPTSSGGRIADRRLIRSDNLQDLTEADVARLVHDLGVSDVIDLRTDSELHIEGPGPLHRVATMTHHHHSLIEERLPSEAVRDVGKRALVMPWEQDDPVRDAAFWAEHYLGYLSRRPDSVAAALRVVAGAPGATVVHCAAGKDRTGTVVAMALDVAGVPSEEIIADYVLTGERIEAIIGRLSLRPAYGEALAKQSIADQAPRAESIQAILTALIDGFGGAAGWLREHAWSEDDVARLRSHLVL